MKNKILLLVVFVLIIVLGMVIYHEKKTNYYFPMPSAVKNEELVFASLMSQPEKSKMLI